MFSVKMNIHEDKELREYIHKLIRGQVKSGLKGAISEEVKTITDKQYGNGGLEEIIRDMVQNALKKDTKLRKFVLEEANKHVRQEVARVFASYREDYSDVELPGIRSLGIPVKVSKGLKTK